MEEISRLNKLNSLNLFFSFICFNLELDELNEWDATMRSKYSNKIEYSSRKIHQFLEALDRVKDLFFLIKIMLIPT